MFFNFFKKKIAKIKIWKEIQALKDRKGFLKAGLPRFNRLFGRDALISAWQLLNYNPGICKATLEILSQLQGKVINDEREEEPGKIIHETDIKGKKLYYGSIDSTPLFLILFSFYFKKTNDTRFLNNHWENILRALNWMEEYGDKDKDFFLEYQRKSSKGLFHQGWKDGFDDHLKIEPPVALVEVQGYQYLALMEISELAERLKKDFELAEKLKERAKILKEKFNQKFWIEDCDLNNSVLQLKPCFKKYFALALNGKKEKKKTVSSNPGHLLFTEIIDEEKIDWVVKKLFGPELFTPFGVRTHSSKEPDFNPRSYHLGSVWPHDNWIIAQGLKKLGFKKEYNLIKNAVLAAYQKLGFLPEFYGVIDGKITLEMEQEPCHPQAWSSSALFDFLQE